MGAEKLLKVKESDLNVGGGLEKIAKLLVEDENATVVGVLKTVGLNVLVDRLSYSACLLYTSPSPRDRQKSRMPSSA